MRRLAGSLFAIATVLSAGTVSAQTYDPNYPVCLHTYGPVGFISCRYASLEQCRFNATGRSAACEINPYFKPAPRVVRRRHPRSR